MPDISDTTNKMADIADFNAKILRPILIPIFKSWLGLSIVMKTVVTLRSGVGFLLCYGCGPLMSTHCQKDSDIKKPNW